MDDIYKQFNTAVDFGELAGDKVDTAALKLATTQDSVGGALNLLKNMLGSDQEKYAKYKAAILAKLGKEYQLAQVTDEELREHLAKLRSTLAVLSVRNHPLPQEGADAPGPAIPAPPTQPAIPALPAAPAVGGVPTAGGIPGALAEVRTGETLEGSAQRLHQRSEAALAEREKLEHQVSDAVHAFRRAHRQRSRALLSSPI